MMTKQEAIQRIERYLEGKATPDEMALVEQAYAALAEPGSFAIDPARQAEIKAELRAALLAKLPRPLGEPRVRKLSRLIPYAAAMLIAVTATWFGIRDEPSTVRLAVTEIGPGGNRATLTLADGRTIDLDEAQTGIVIGDEDITYRDGTSVGTVIPNEELMLTTPKGGTYQVTLPDGSKVWLNAASTLRYPSRFPSGERVVQLDGEAYFSVTGIVSHLEGGRGVTRTPFKVQTSGQTIEVLGTQFNVAAYPHDPESKTTLVEGSVRLEANGARVELAPGEQGKAVEGSGLTRYKVDVAAVTSWKSGRFSFDGKSFAQIMDEVGRWYDVEVVYEGEVPQETFFGDAFRTDNLSIILDLLDSGRIRYRVTADRKLVITNH